MTTIELLALGLLLFLAGPALLDCLRRCLMEDGEAKPRNEAD